MNNEPKKGGKVDFDVYIGIALIILCAAAAFNALSFPVAARRFPLLACLLLTILSVILIVRGVRRSVAIRQAGGVITPLLPWKTTKYALVTFAMTGAYIFVMEKVDFFVATVIFVPAMMLFMRVKKAWIIALSTVGITFFCWFMFVYQLNIRMP